MAWGRMPLGDNPPEPGPSAVTVPNLPSESTITISGRSCGNRCTVDIVDKAPVTFLPKNTVHTRVMADDDIVIGGGNTRSGLSAYAHVVARGFAAHKRQITDGRVVVSAGIGSERFPTDGRVGAAGGIVHERKVTGGSVGSRRCR